jgi:hypothetical protein
MEISGKIIHLLDVKTGTSKSGKEWISQDFVIETEGQYPKKVCIRCFGDNLCDQLTLYKIGDTITIKYNLESNEGNGNWFTTVNAWNLAGHARNKAKSQTEDPFHPDNDPAFTSDSSSDDLPF